MKNAHGLKRSLRILSAVVLVLILCGGAVIAGIVYINWSAERRARKFCDEIPIGSDISAATAKANDRKILWGAYRGYTFYFPGLIFDKAVCEVSVKGDGKVISKIAEMEYD